MLLVMDNNLLVMDNNLWYENKNIMDMYICVYRETIFIQKC